MKRSMTNITKTRTVDTYGNIRYVITRDGQEIGVVSKTCSAYEATLPNGSWAPAHSIQAGTDWLIHFTK